jgi:hypothetical protein
MQRVGREGAESNGDTGRIAPQAGTEIVEFRTLVHCIDRECDEKWSVVVIAKERQERQEGISIDPMCVIHKERDRALLEYGPDHVSKGRCH